MKYASLGGKVLVVRSNLPPGAKTHHFTARRRHFVKSKGRTVNEDGGGEGDRICQGNEAGRVVH